MAFMLTLKQLSLSLGLFFGIKDIIEITVLTVPIYLFSRWLLSDITRHLLLWFYGYCTAIMLASFFDLQTILFCLLAVAPAALLLLVALHQKKLQEHFVTFKHMIPAEHSTQSWHESLIRECLIVAHANKDITCVIEQRDIIEPFLASFIPLQGAICNATLSFVTASSQYKEDAMLLFSSTGNLMAVNALWKLPTGASWLSGAINVEKLVEHTALFYSTHSDAITVSLSHKRRLFSIITHGEKYDNLSASQALALLQKKTLSTPLSKEFSYVSQTSQRERAS